MSEVILTCSRCHADIHVMVEFAFLRVDILPTIGAELLFCCPVCGDPEAQQVGARVLSFLLLVGMNPTELGEPTLDISDRPPAGAPFERDDLLDWHLMLRSVESVAPWE